MGGGEVPGLLKHFYFIMKEFLQSRKHVSKKVQAICLWWHKPVIDQELLQSLPNLKVIVNSGAGVDHLDLKLVASFGVKMAHAPCAVSSSTADRLVEVSFLCVGPHSFLILQFIVTGTTLGIVGMGSTMYKTILRAKAFEMNVLYHNRTHNKMHVLGDTWSKVTLKLLS
uniref:D-isomer specific 2-hydroxyacid dehydrogenase catalytic domain-containing protein n=1 Tax=Amazona collaria TaxID=241587 RepID=A0A8B9IRM4_9PSIT